MGGGSGRKREEFDGDDGTYMVGKGRRDGRQVKEVSYNDNNARDYLDVKEECRIVRKIRSITRVASE